MKRRYLAVEMMMMIKKRKSYVLAPIFFVFLILTGLVFLSLWTGGAAAPFIYSLF